MVGVNVAKVENGVWGETGGKRMVRGRMDKSKRCVYLQSNAGG